jgi:mannose-6-phosphate isomerase-like protein (cupin superfamily)
VEYEAISIEEKFGKFSERWSPRVIARMNDYAVHLEKGDLFVVPRGVEHRPHSSHECRIMLIEPAGTVNTGDAGGALTAKNDVWI